MFGHTHNSVEDTFFQKCIQQINDSEELDLRRCGDQKICAINVGACMPYMEYEPRSLKELMRDTTLWAIQRDKGRYRRKNHGICNC